MGDSQFLYIRLAENFPKNAIPNELRDEIFARDGWQCVACSTREDLTLDHIQPLSLGGRSTRENLQTLCRSCNSRKGARV